MSKKDFVIIFSVFAITGSTIYTFARRTETTPVTNTQQARTVAEKEFKKYAGNKTKVQILKIEQFENPEQPGWLVHHNLQKNPLFIHPDGSMEYMDEKEIIKSNRMVTSEN